MKYIEDILYNLHVHFFPVWKMDELLHDNPTKWPVHRVNTQINLGIRSVSDPSHHCPHEELWVLIATHWAHSERLWSDWMDVQSDNSLRWVHTSFCLFCHASAQMVLMNTAIFSFSNADKLCPIIFNYAFLKHLTDLFTVANYLW